MPRLLCYGSLPGLFLVSMSIFAHDFWLEASDYRPANGQMVDISLLVGEDFTGDRLIRVPEWFTRFKVAHANEQQDIPGNTGDDPIGRLRLGQPGIHTVLYSSTREFVELEPEKFNIYLREEGLEFIEGLRSASGESELPAKEFYSRYAKAIIVVDQQLPLTHEYNAVTGLALEIIPKVNPLAIQVGDTVPFQVLYKAEPLEGALLVAFSRSSPESKAKIRTDDNGMAEFHLKEPGDWLIKTVHMERAHPALRNADWESFWSSLTMSVPETLIGNHNQADGVELDGSAAKDCQHIFSILFKKC